MKRTGVILLFLFMTTSLFILNNPAYSDSGQDSQSTIASYQQKMMEKAIKDQEKQLAKVKEFEPDTPIGKFMGGFVSAYLIVSIPILIFAYMLACGLANDEIWLKVIKYLFAVTAYLLINYVIWVGLRLVKFKYPDIAVLITFVASASLLAYVHLSLRFEGAKERNKHRIPTWICPNCGNQNHYNIRCWNCKTEKQTV